ncbi:serine hydrolase domain-containing protein [Lactiplantibacillus daowaiensis]|uniref:Serine hydrolase domain-containing protein n=1 Tax=Lactiplantibacillus daowaiensis TaxID=2559918 RepID=A0ABW1RW77_9LACO|nr:serine hydrolase domain-containing protein [Lactiplantibacillus daowaiensis]
MRNAQRVLVGLISATTLMSGAVGVVSASQASYVRVKPHAGKVAVYKQVPTTAKQVKKAQHKTVSANQVYRVVKRRAGHGGTYVQLRGTKLIGWLKQTQTTKLTHVNANGTLAMYRTRSASGSVTAKNGVKRLTIDVNGPQATQKSMQYRTLTAKQATAAHLKVTKTVQTDLGTYYQLAGKGVAGWVKATTVVLSLPANADTIVTAPKPVSVQVAPAQGIVGIPAAPVETVGPTTPVKTSTKPVVVRPVTKPTSQSNSSVATKTVTPTSTTKPATGTSTTGQLTEAQALSQINALITQNHIMGTLLVTNNGSAGVKVMNYGYANVAKKIANNTDEPYPLASLEKALTGAVVQRLINEGKLSMTTTLSKYYPQVPYANEITIRELLDHTSGIHMGEPVPATPLTNDAAQVAFTIAHLDSTGQFTWSYSNANFTLLSGIIGKVTGKSLMSNLQSDVLTPLGMKHTFLYNQIPSSAVTPLSYTYKNGQSQADDISTNLLSSELGCGNVYASVGDYYTFINSLFTGKLDGKAGFAELSDGLKLKYSGGVYYQADNNVRIGGADNGFHSYYFGTNDGKIAVVLFSNQSSWSGANSVSGLIEKILLNTSTK